MEGYEVKWKDTHKYITYTCPNGKRCRDIRLHEEKYLKENMEDEFRIRKEIIARAEGTGTEESGRGKANDELPFRTGEVVDGNGATPADTNQYARFNSGITENTGDVERPLGYAGGTADAADSSRRADGADTDGVSGDASAAGGTDSDDDLNLDGNLPITGWESERELFTTTILGGTDGETPLEADGFRFTDPDDLSDNLGIDSAYLAADVMNILDNDTHVEDCTTMNQPPRNKKNTQSGGFNMSM